MLFASLGASVTLTGRNEDNLQKVAARCLEAGSEDRKVRPKRNDHMYLYLQSPKFKDPRSQEDTMGVLSGPAVGTVPWVWGLQGVDST